MQPIRVTKGPGCHKNEEVESISSIQMKIYQSNTYREDINCNYSHNILRLFDVRPNFPFTTSETKRDCL